MNSMADPDLASHIVEERIRDAEARRRARAVRRAADSDPVTAAVQSRAPVRGRRRARAWPSRRSRPFPAAEGEPSTATAASVIDTGDRVAMELEELLDRAVDRVVDSGTRAEYRTLRAMAFATRGVCPGAAAALVDWSGSEPVRLRAFGIVHGAILNRLSSRARSHLLATLLGSADQTLAA
jgi:hypothetical protein